MLNTGWRRFGRTFARHRSFGGDRSGATAIEYAVIGGLVSIAIVVGATQIGSKLGDTFQLIADTLGSL